MKTVISIPVIILSILVSTLFASRTDTAEVIGVADMSANIHTDTTTANAHADTASESDNIDTDTSSTAVVIPASVFEPAIKKVFIIPISGTVDHGMAAFVARGINEAQQNDNALLVFEIDTYGGLVDAAFDIVEHIVSSNMPSIAYVRTRAISAGALIAFAANRLVMRHHTTIGDVAPLINTSEGPQMLGEKHQSPIRAKFRTLAQRNGYSETLSEAMVTEEIAVYEITLPDTVMYLDSARVADLSPHLKEQIKSQRLVVRRGELLTMTETEALQYGFSKMTVADIDEMLQAMGYADAEVIAVGKNWSENFVSIIAMLAPILMMIGFASIYIETRSPGFGIAGVIGIICLALVFFGQHAVGLAAYTELLLLLLGATLLLVEIFVLPGFGVGAVGIILMVIGMVLSFQNFVIPSPEFPWQASIMRKNIMTVLFSILGAMVLVLIFFKYFFEHLGRVVKGPYLSADLKSALSNEGMVFVPNIGDKGVTSTALRPAGKVRMGKDTCDVVAEDGQFIEKGITVIVTQIHGNRIVVENYAEET